MTAKTDCLSVVAIERRVHNIVQAFDALRATNDPNAIVIAAQNAKASESQLWHDTMHAIATGEIVESAREIATAALALVDVGSGRWRL